MNIFNEFMSIMNRGGPIMWVIFIASSVAIVLMVWQARKLMVYSKQSLLEQSMSKNQDRYIHTILSVKRESPLSQLLMLLNWSEINNKQDFAKEMNVHITDIALKVEGSLPTIATIGSLLPMLGLLGTVTGMINVFEVIAVQGSGKPDEMAHGISQAMLTTASGLIIAIPVIFMHHLLARRQTFIMKNLVQSMQVILHADIAKIKKLIITRMATSLPESDSSLIPSNSVNVTE